MSASLSSTFIGWFVFFTALIFSTAGITLFRRLSITNNWLDHPNERSSHTVPTPRGGGVVIVIIGLTTYIAAAIAFGGQPSWGYVIGGALIALISWLDDIYSLAYLSRLGVHCLAAILVVADGGYLHVFGVSKHYSIDLGIAGALVTAVWIIWSINAYNFMDGIDGLAGVQGVVAAAFWGLITVTAPQLFVFNVALAGACLGFLVHNWPPARVFLGDVGSAFLGFTFGSMAILPAKQTTVDLVILPPAAVLLLWPFNFDAGLTRLRKALRFERFWEPHREHLYQRLAETGYSSSGICAIYGLWALMAGLSTVLLLRTDGWISAMPLLFLIVISLVIALMVKRSNERSDSVIDGR
jgi:UDP-N-acetylmuramyl pentapeptide phosphotransferase/UDP-N-acetylglucosamine-1-phosphate transferase